MTFRFGVITLIPEILEVLQYGVIGSAIKKGIADVKCWNPRDWSSQPSRRVDDKPYGGGAGMVMCYEPLQKTISYARTQLPQGCKTIYLSPQGKKINQADLREVAVAGQPLLFIAGRYEGIDERVILHYVNEEWSLGDFVLSGGELAAAVFIDAIIRLLPGSLGHLDSAKEDSFMNGLLEYPHYTRPASIGGLDVPTVLLNGNHHDIERWRRKQSLGKTWLKRPDLLNKISLSEADFELLDEFKSEQG